MPSKNQILATDFVIGLLFLLPTLSFFTIVAEWWVVLAVTGHAAGCMLMLHLCEHGAPRISLAVFCMQLGATIAVTALNAPIAAGMEFALFVGIALGILGYRFVYGVLRPIPDRRVATETRRTSTPSFFR